MTPVVKSVSDQLTAIIILNEKHILGYKMVYVDTKMTKYCSQCVVQNSTYCLLVLSVTSVSTLANVYLRKLTAAQPVPNRTSFFRLCSSEANKVVVLAYFFDT